MKYSIYIRGRGWAFQLADSLNKDNKLKYIVSSYPKFVVKKYNVPLNKVKSVIFLEILVRFLRKINKYLKKIKLNFNSNLPGWIADWLADFIYSSFYLDDADVFMFGFGNSNQKLIKKAKEKNIKTIYFLNNSSPLFREKLKFEYNKLGLLESYQKEDEDLTKKINQCIRDSDYVGCISSFQRETYIDEGILDRKKAITSIMGVDTSVFYPKKIHNNKFIVIGVGNDFVRKGFKYLIEGFNKLKLPNSELWLLGNLDKNQIKKVCTIESNNLFFDSIKEFDLPNFYNQSSVFCLPTLEEGAPAVISQAMACGLPIIVTKNCQGPDVIDNNKNGFIINEMDTLNISEKIKYFYDNPKKTSEMGLSSAKFAKENLSYDIMTKNITSFLENNK